MTNTYKCLLVDDDDFSRETLEDIIADIPELELIKSLSESKMAIKYLATLKPDIAFLDINMPNKSGIDLQNEITDLQLDTKIIFVTAHEGFVVEAFKNNAFDYLIKPIKKSELKESLKRLFQETNKQTAQTQTEEVPNIESKNELIIKNAYDTLILQKNDIAYIHADGSYTNVYLVNGKVETLSKNLGKTEHYFKIDGFYKISRSCIVNLNYLTKINRLNRTVFLEYDEKTVQLKASREKLYDLEICLKR